MFFTNIIGYKIKQKLDTTPEKIESVLSDFKSKPLSSQQISNFGWSNPMGEEGNMLSHVVGNDVLICLQKNEKILPPDVIKREVKDKIDRIEKQNDRKLKKAEKDSIKEEVISQLIPRAFDKSTLTYAWIDFDSDMLYVNSSSYGKAEVLISLLRKTLGGLAVIPVTLKNDIPTIMTSWVKESVFPPNFFMGNDIEIKSILEDGVITGKKEDLTDERIKAHLTDDEKQVTNLSLEWNDSVSFSFSESGIVKKVKFKNVEETDERSGDYKESFDADFVIMKNEVKVFFPKLLEAFGGIEED